MRGAKKKMTGNAIGKATAQVRSQRYKNSPPKPKLIATKMKVMMEVITNPITAEKSR